MDLPDAAAVPAPTRFSLAGGFAIAVLLASMLRPPGTVLAQPGPLGTFGWDKWVHLASYATLGLLIGYALLARSWLVVATIVLASLVFGAFVEVIQSTIPWRTMQVADVGANTLGTAIGLVAWRLAATRLLAHSTSESGDVPEAAADGGTDGASGSD